MLEVERAAVRHRRLPLETRGFVRRFLNGARLRRLAKIEHFALVHAHGWSLAAAGLRLARASSLPWILDIVEPFPVTARAQRLARAVQGSQALFRVPSVFLADFLVRDVGIAAERIRRVPPGVDLVTYNAPRVTPERLQKLTALWRIPEQGSVILVGAPMEPGQGHETLLEAVKALGRADVFVVIVGGDSSTSPALKVRLERLVAANAMQGQVVMPDQCPDWPAALWLASVVVSVGEAPRGQTPEILAAQALGRPVIVSRSGARPEMVREGMTAWVVPPDDRSALEAALTEAVQTTAEQRISLAHLTRAFVSETFPLDTWCQRMMTLYAERVSRPSDVTCPGEARS